MAARDRGRRNVSKLGRWMAPCEIVAEAMRTLGKDLADLSLAEEARLEKFAQSLCEEVPEGGNVWMVCIPDQEIIAEIGRSLGVTVKVVA